MNRWLCAVPPDNPIIRESAGVVKGGAQQKIRGTHESVTEQSGIKQQTTKKPLAFWQKMWYYFYGVGAAAGGLILGPLEGVSANGVFNHFGDYPGHAW